MPLECPPHWEAIGQKIASIRDRIVADGPKHALSVPIGDWRGLTHTLFAEELLCRPEVDRAARHVAEHGTPPEQLSAESRHYLVYRMHCALDFLGMLYPPEALNSPIPDLPVAWTEQAAIRWLLVDLWFRRHDHWLKLTAIAQSGPFPLYGIEPADPKRPE